MDFSKLNRNEMWAAIGAAVTIIGSLVSYAFSVSTFAILSAIALLVVIFLPMLSPNVKLPGSKGSLMLLTGGLTGVLMLLGFLTLMSFLFTAFGVTDLIYLIAVAGAVVAAWASWQEFQAEGGKFHLGTTPSAPPSATAAPPAPPAAPPPSMEPPAAPPAGTMEEAPPPPREEDRPPQP